MPLPGHLKLAVAPVVELIISQSSRFAPNRHSVFIKNDRTGHEDGEQEDEDWRREHVALFESRHQLAGDGVRPRGGRDKNFSQDKFLLFVLPIILQSIIPKTVL